MPLWVNTITIERIRLLNQNRCCYESFYYGQRSTVYRLSHLRSCLCDGAQRGAARAERAPFSSPHYGPYLRLAKSPVTCHHCENAPCAQSCPNGAITQHSDSVQVNQQKCIGCKACVVACPFGTMDMLIAPLENDSVKASAHKCDLCSKGRKARPALKTARQRCLRSPPQPCWISWLSSADSARLDALPWHSEAVQSVPPQTKRQQMQNTPARGEPEKLSPDARAGHFNEIYLPFRPEQAQREASRCLKCGDHSICEWTCPLHNHIPQWIERIRAGISSVRLSFLTRLTVYRKLPAASVHRIDYVKAPAPAGCVRGGNHREYRTVYLGSGAGDGLDAGRQPR